MCEASAYLYKNGEEELYLESVDILQPEGDQIYLKNLFGEQKTFRGKVREISLLKHKIVLEEIK
jgi:predicted RNA-binding protein